jgi:TolA-binding protein
MFADVMRKSPGSELAPISQLRRADSLYRLRKLPEALDSYRELLRVYPRSDYVPDAEYGISLLALARGDFAQFARLSKEFAAEYPENSLAPRVLAQLGRQLLLKRRYEEAGEIFEWLLRDYPGEESSPQVVILAALADRGWGNRMETAASLREELAQGDGLLEAERRFRLANLYLEEGNCEGALREYRDILRNRPEHPLTPYAVFDSAGCHVRGENPAAAMEAYRLLAERFGESPLLPGAQYQRGVLALERGRYDEAEEAFLRIHPGAGKELEGGAAFQLGKTLQRTGRGPEAYDEYLKSMSVSPQGKFSLRAAFRAAGIARGMGRKEEAEKLYRLVMAGEDEVIAELAREELGEAGQGAAHGGAGK